jgi:uncharacterized protein YneR
MKIHITKPAYLHLKKEMDLEAGDMVSFFLRYGGFNPHNPGFSLGISKGKVENIGSHCEIDNIVFAVSENDLWYFDNKDLTVKYKKKLDEIEFVVK